VQGRHPDRGSERPERERERHPGQDPRGTPARPVRSEPSEPSERHPGPERPGTGLPVPERPLVPERPPVPERSGEPVRDSTRDPA